MGLGKRHSPARVTLIPDSLEGVAEFIGKEKVTKTLLFGFDGAEITELCVHTRNALCRIVLPKRPHSHAEAVAAMGWPVPAGLMWRDLPRAAGLLYERYWPAPAEAPPETEDPEDEPVRPVRVRRTRAPDTTTAAPGAIRVRRTRILAA